MLVNRWPFAGWSHCVIRMTIFKFSIIYRITILWPSEQPFLILFLRVRLHFLLFKRDLRHLKMNCMYTTKFWGKNNIAKIPERVGESKNAKYEVWQNYCDCLFNFTLSFLRDKNPICWVLLLICLIKAN